MIISVPIYRTADMCRSWAKRKNVVAYEIRGRTKNNNFGAVIDMSTSEGVKLLWVKMFNFVCVTRVGWCADYMNM